HLIDRSVIGLQNAFAAQCRPRKVKRRQGLVGGPRGVNGGVQQLAFSEDRIAPVGARGLYPANSRPFPRNRGCVCYIMERNQVKPWLGLQ
ncbi:MAG: hypothetical protein WCA78_12180, partial [Rhizomicrobium sp.]